MPIYVGPGTGPRDGSSVVRYPTAWAALDAATKTADVLIVWGLPDLAKRRDGLKIPVVICVSHGSGEWTSKAMRSSESGATHFVAISEPAVDTFSSEVRKTATLIHNGIDVERCTPMISRAQMRTIWGFEEHHRLIGYVGRYSSEKNPEAAARAAMQLGGDYRAVYAGEGWMEATLRKQVTDIADTRARFVPMNRQVGNVLSALDVFVLASPSEGFSLSVTEAWYCGLPVVATRVGAIPELERRHGNLVSSVPIDPTPDELARAVERALTPEFRAEVIPRAHQAVCLNYSASAMAERWTEYLFSAFGKGVLRNGKSLPSQHTLRRNSILESVRNH